MCWLGVGGLAEGLKDLKGPILGASHFPLTPPLGPKAWSLSLELLHPQHFPLNLSLNPGGAGLSGARFPVCPSAGGPAWPRGLGAAAGASSPPSLNPSPWAPTLCIPCPSPPPAPASWNPGTLEVSGPYRVAWVVVSFFFFWAMQGGGAGREGREADNWARASQGWRLTLVHVSVG